MIKRTAWERFTSRPFLLAVIGSIGALISRSYGVPTEVIGLFTAPIIAFILGEQYRDGKAEEFVAPPIQQAMIENRADAIAKTKCDAPEESVLETEPDIGELLESLPSAARDELKSQLVKMVLAKVGAR